MRIADKDAGPDAAQQKKRPEPSAPHDANRSASQGKLYVLGADGKPQALGVRTGISDGSHTELLLAPDSPAAAALKEGTEVIVASKASAAAPAGGAARNSAGHMRPPF